MNKYIILLALCLGIHLGEAQSQIVTATDVDTFVLDTKVHSPGRAAMLSAAIPGMGQIYNGKYWKVPVIYTGVAALIYFINDNNKWYGIYRQAYFDAKYGGVYNDEIIERFPDLGNAKEVSQTNIESFYSLKESRRKYREYCILGMGILYLMNIMDAHVDAYFLNFDVGKDLTVQLDPYVDKSLFADNIIGVKLSLDFK